MNKMWNDSEMIRCTIIVECRSILRRDKDSYSPPDDRAANSEEKCMSWSEQLLSDCHSWGQNLCKKTAEVDRYSSLFQIIIVRLY